MHASIIPNNNKGAKFTPQSVLQLSEAADLESSSSQGSEDFEEAEAVATVRRFHGANRQDPQEEIKIPRIEEEPVILKNVIEVGRNLPTANTILNIQSDDDGNTLEEDGRDTVDNSPNKHDPNISQITPLPLVLRGVYSLVSDMKLGWKPQNEKKANYLSEVPPVIAFKYAQDPGEASKPSQ